MNLVECMVGIGLASLLLLGIGEIATVTFQSAYHIHQQLSEMTDVAVVEELLRDRIRQAGFTPCGAIDHLQTLAADHALLRGVMLLPEGVRLSRLSSDYQRVEVLNAFQLRLPQQPPFSLRAVLVLSDCYHAEVIYASDQVRNGDHGLLTLAQPLRFVYQTPLFLGKWTTEQITLKRGRLIYQRDKPEVLSATIEKFQVMPGEWGGKQGLKVSMQTQSGHYEWLTAFRIK